MTSKKKRPDYRRPQAPAARPAEPARPAPAPADPSSAQQARRDERARISRTSRLPFLYDYALRGRHEAVLAGVLQIALVIAVVLVLARLVTGRWLPLGVGFVVIAVVFAVQGVCRRYNARAGRG